ncbi:hypothetical protein [Salinibacterium sp. ZJ450]|uniref:hypothetical protein n=1 Tax=Salinibacterium sp. ZJ450 TaxID=2708338 RepID=UPI00141E17CD|nr:hypothetical protein [Salinibacterium sp. ZJ450]
MTRSARTTVVHGAAVAALCTAFLSGCAGGPAIADLNLPAKDRASWVMPLDDYYFPSSSQIESYAENLLVSECMREAGFQWPIMPESLEDADYEGMMSILTLEVAQTWGYHEAPSAERAARIENFTKMNTLAQSQPGFDTVITPCVHGVRAEHSVLGGVSKSVNFIAPSYWQTAEDAATTDTVKAAADAWRDCLDKAGYGGAPDSPLDGMPTEEMRVQLGIPGYAPGVDGPPEPPLTEMEIALATADVQCRESSGWTQAQYDAQWDRQVEFIRDNADRLSSDRETWLKDRQVLLELIAKHAPAQR